APPTLLDTVVQSLRCLPELDGLVIAESAVVAKGVTLAELRQRLTGRNDARERRSVGRIVPQSQSIIECMARYWLRRAGFHVESQVNIPGMGHLDLIFPPLPSIGHALRASGSPRDMSSIPSPW
ncbi:MAG TPA: hypothetical protein VF885_03080, partial [Arthrobacter sp.]